MRKGDDGGKSRRASQPQVGGLYARSLPYFFCSLKHGMRDLQRRASPLANNDAVAARAGVGHVDGLVLVAASARGAVVVTATAGATTVDLDTVALAGDAVALAGARAVVGAGGAVAGQGGAGRGAVGAVGQGRARGRHRGRAEVGDDVLVETGAAEAGCELLDLLLVVVVGVEDVLGGMGRHGLGGLDLGDGQGATLGDVDGKVASVAGGAVLPGRGVARRALAAGGGLAAGLVGGRGRLGGGGLGVAGNVEDVELTTGGRLGGGVDAGVVCDVVAVDDVVVPVALASLEGRVLELEGALPRARLGRGLVLGKGDLADVVVPGAEQVDGLDTGGDAEREGELDGRHDD
jgi:hypothetical protein